MTIRQVFKSKVLSKIYNHLGYFFYFDSKVFFPKNSLVFNRVMKEGIYENENIHSISKFIKPDSYYFDVGANIGLLAIPILKLNPDCRIVSCEPSPNTLPFLKRTHINHKNRKNWLIIEEAISDIAGETRQFKIGENHLGAYDSFNDTKRTIFKKSIQVKTTTIDTIWDNLKNPLVSFIKCDIEGADIFAIKGGLRCIMAHKPSILIEWNDVNIKSYNFKSSDLLDLCETIGYDCFALPHEVLIRLKSEMDISIKFTENYLLKPKCDADAT